VEVPAAEPQILLRVRFADVDRSAANSIGVNLLSTGAAHSVGQVGRGTQHGVGLPGADQLEQAEHGAAEQAGVADARREPRRRVLAQAQRDRGPRERRLAREVGRRAPDQPRPARVARPG